MKADQLLIQILLLLLIPGGAFCQSGNSITGSSDKGRENYLTGELFKPDFLPDITTYFSSDWLEGEILLKDGTLKKNEKIRYNGLLDELFWLEPVSRQTVKLDREEILRFHFYNYKGDTTVFFRKLKVKREGFIDSTEVFGQELFLGNLSLYLQHSFYFAGSKSVLLNKRYVLKDTYKQEPVYYIYFPDKMNVGFKRLNRRNIYSYFPDKKNQIRRFINSSTTGKIKDTQDIVSLIRYINSIIVQ